MRFRLRTLLIGVTAICLLLGLAVWLTPEVDGDYYAVQRFPLGDDRELIIWAEWFWEINQAICYEIRDGGRTLVRPTYFADGPTGNTPEFEVVISSDGNAIGCYETSDPTKFRCVYDFSTDEGWPGGEMWHKRVPWHAETIALEKEVREKIENKLQSTGARSNK